PAQQTDQEGQAHLPTPPPTCPHQPVDDTTKTVQNHPTRPETTPTQNRTGHQATSRNTQTAHTTHQKPDRRTRHRRSCAAPNSPAPASPSQSRALVVTRHPRQRSPYPTLGSVFALRTLLAPPTSDQKEPHSPFNVLLQNRHKQPFRPRHVRARSSPAHRPYPTAP